MFANEMSFTAAWNQMKQEKRFDFIQFNNHIQTPFDDIYSFTSKWFVWVQFYRSNFFFLKIY